MEALMTCDTNLRFQEAMQALVLTTVNINTVNSGPEEEDTYISINPVNGGLDLQTQRSYRQ
jgi:hypothetical protein